ncbi:beta-secretase 1-like isoform X1 [Mya arenaria]|uniref:beta-secretase 1-like isoform X1 n=1 Tax=Mya arenaria TaxID=6604 RepID=UPI0022E99260|nr:beta-secretase 1-like isoform X1 [Mya arenaria]
MELKFVKIFSGLLVLNLVLSPVLGNLYKRESEHAARDPREIGQPVGEVDHQIGNLRGQTGEGYSLKVLIGTPPQELNVLIDTGSSNFAVACSQNDNIDTYFRKDKSSTYVEVGTAVNVPYTVGSWSGTLGRDNVTIATMPGSMVEANIACINEAENFYINGSNWQGILGLAYTDIARPDSSIEPYFDSLVKDGKFPNFFGVQLCGLGYISPNPDKMTGGSIVFGSLAHSLYHSELYATPLYKEWFYEVILVDVEVNGQSLAMDCKEYNFEKTIVDTGTTNLRLPRRVFTKLVHMMKQQITNSEWLHEGFWTGIENLCWREGQAPYGDFPDVSVVLPINNTAAFRIMVTPQQYLRWVGDDNDDKPENDCFKLAISGMETASVLGAIVMEGYYVVFDRARKQVMFAESTCDGLKPSINASIPYSGNFMDCAYKKPKNHDRTLTIVGYVMAGICGICVLPLIFLIAQWQCRRLRCGRKLLRQNSDSNDLMNTS